MAAVMMRGEHEAGILLAIPGERVAREVYLRRRLAVALIGAGLVLTAVLGLRGWSERSEGVPASALGAAPASAQVYVVQPGDTLWRIAERFGGERVAAYADRLVAANGGTTLQVGQRVVLPSAAGG